MDRFQDKLVAHDRLLLDPNNYRFQESPDWVAASDERFHEEAIQDRAYRRLRDGGGLVELKNSILTNGFLPVERVVVREYEYADDGDEYYVVVEGNRRVAALQWIAEDHLHGATAPERMVDDLQNVPVLVLADADADPVFHEALMGIRHVSGIREWGGYQRAKLVAALREDHALDAAEIAARLGMSAHEVNRRYRAFRALAQMQNHEEYGSRYRADMYPLFHEAVSLPLVREWLGWDEGTGEFTDDEQLAVLYELITPNEAENGNRRDAKIRTYDQVRELRSILPNAEARQMLFDPSRSFLDAVTIAKHEELSRAWASKVASAISALDSIGALELEKLSLDDLETIGKLKDMATRLLENYEKITSS